MTQSIESNLGFTVLLGGPGMGKTTLLLQLLAQYRDSARTAFIFQTQCKRYELLRFLGAELELPDMKGDEVSLHQRLKEMLVNEARAGRKVLIFIDEAQNLRPVSLEAIRLLSDFETARAKLLHIILAGSERLGETLLTPGLSQLAQRVSTICRLEPLTPEEVKGYVAFRLEVAGSRVAEHLFTPEALTEIAEQSEGIPRVVNSISYRALLLAYTASERRVSHMLARQAAKDLDLSHGTMNAAIMGELQRTETPPDLSSDLIISERNHAVLDSKSSSPKFPEATTDEKLRFQPPGMSAVAGPVEQPQSPQPQGKVAPEARWKEGGLAESAGTKHYSAQQADFKSKPGNFGTTRSTLVPAGLMLLALGLGAGWYELRVKSDTTVKNAAAVNPITASTEGKEQSSLLSDTAQLYSPAATAESNANPADRKPIDGNKTKGLIVQALPQRLFPSKVRSQPPEPIELAVPSTTSNIAGIPQNLTLPVGAMPNPLPAPPQAQVTIAKTDEPSTATESKDKDKDKYQGSLRQPIKVVPPKYPEMAELGHIEGVVLLELRIDSIGRVQTVRTVSGNSLLGEAAEEAARQWQYPRSPKDQPPVSTVTRVRFNFKLNPETKR